jgi:hypothetical protein
LSAEETGEHRIGNVVPRWLHAKKRKWIKEGSCRKSSTFWTEANEGSKAVHCRFSIVDLQMKASYIGNDEKARSEHEGGKRKKCVCFRVFSSGVWRVSLCVFRVSRVCLAVIMSNGEHCISGFRFLMSDLAGPRPTQDSFSVVAN